MMVNESGIVEIYTKNTNSFSVGRVFCQNKDDVVFEDIDPQGKITGYYLMKKNIISQLEYDTEYLHKISKYIEYGETHPYSAWFCLKKPALDTEKSLILQVLEYAKRNNIVITIEMVGEEELEAGYVKKIESGKIDFSCLDVSNAQLREDITVSICDIICIEFESIDNLLLQYANTTGDR